MNSEKAVQNICESIRECFMYAKKARGNTKEFNTFIARARRWQEMLLDYMSAQEARAIFLRAYREILER